MFFGVILNLGVIKKSTLLLHIYGGEGLLQKLDKERQITINKIKKGD